MRELISESDLRRRVAELGAAISRDFAESEDLVVVGVLRGSLCFLADLVRAIDRPLRLDCIGLRSYDGVAGGDPKMTTDLVDDIAGADVLLVEDIIERGTTLSAAMAALKDRGARSITVCTLLTKDIPREGGILPVEYCGFTIGPEFVVGYGLDYRQRFRNLPFVGVLEDADLAGLSGEG